ncbi:hepatic lectin-like isoform X2 [Oreochromis aureus]|uniref:C-type lectin domain-containing protein n=1 Tax=Oreochromis aureus TaxID=47969 RepID=A0AAZ1X4W7_OREAU|nr:hepatic lectin-like isoform X2 [Oreochromis aureus]
MSCPQSYTEDSRTVTMPEAEVLYSAVKFKVRRESIADTYSEVKISKTQPSTTEPEDSQQAVSCKGSKITSERVALLVLSVLLAAAVIGLGVTIQTIKNLEVKCEAENKRFRDKQSYKCEDGWKKHGGKCYYFSIDKTSWNESRDECRAKKGDLVKIESREEQKFLERKLKEIKNSDDKFWIGLIYSAKNNTWVWTDGSPLTKSLTFWKNKDKDINNGTKGANPDEQSCLRVEAKGGAKLLSCKKSHRSICEKQTVTECCKCAVV